MYKEIITFNLTNVFRPKKKITQCPNCQHKSLMYFSNIVECMKCNLEFDLEDFETCEDESCILSI